MNNLTIIGYLGRDPEFSETQTGTKICRMSVAETAKIKGKDLTTWFNIVAFGERAERCKRGLVKGSRVCVMGSFRSRRYTDKDGIDRTDWSLNIDYIEFLSSPNRENKATQAQQRPQPQFQPGHQQPWGANQNQGRWTQPSSIQTTWDQYQAQQNPQVSQPIKNNPDIPF